MPGRRPNNLARRQGVYYFRGFLPRDVHLSARRREVRVSPRTCDSVYARARARVAALAFDSLCRQLRSMIEMHAPDEDIRAVVQSFGAALLKSATPPAPFEGAAADYGYARTRFWVEEEIGALKRAISANDYAAAAMDIDTPLRQTQAFAKQLVSGQFGGAPLSPERLNLLKAGIARAPLEERKHDLRRLDDPFALLEVSDPLFAPAPLPSQKPTGASPGFSAAVDLYVQAKSGVVWTPRTEEENRRILRLATEHFGAATRIDAISLYNVRAFRDSVIAWRKKPASSAGLAGIANAPAGQRIGPKSAAKYFGYVSAAFAYWTNEGFLEKSPVGKLTGHVPHQTAATARVPFPPSDLKALYSSPIFVGCAGQPRREEIEQC